MQRSRAERLDRSRFLPVSLQDRRTARRTRCCPWPTRRACRSTCGTAMKRCGSPATIACCCAPSSICWRTPSSIRLPARGSRWARSGWAMPRVCTWRTRAWASRPRPARLCQAFYRAAGARRHADGVGMGLAIVAAVAKGHGAEVMVKSRPSQGSTFILTMPLLRAARLKTKILQNPAPRGGPVWCLDGAFLSKAMPASARLERRARRGTRCAQRRFRPAGGSLENGFRMKGGPHNAPAFAIRGFIRIRVGAHLHSHIQRTQQRCVLPCATRSRWRCPSRP